MKAQGRAQLQARAKLFDWTAVQGVAKHHLLYPGSGCANAAQTYGTTRVWQSILMLSMGLTETKQIAHSETGWPRRSTLF